MSHDLQQLQPKTMLNQFFKGNVKIDSHFKEHQNHSKDRIDNKEVATNIVNNKLSQSLGIVNSTDNSSDSNKGNDFDFQAVAKNILSFVTQSLSNAKQNGATEDELKDMASDAEKGLQEGLASAEEDLSKLGLLTSDLEKGISSVAKQVEKGLSDFTDTLFSSTSLTNTGMSSYKEGIHYSLKEGASFEFETKEGDQVKISFNASYQQQNASVLNLTDDRLNYASSSESEFQGAFSFEINGDLNEDEQQAINELMNSLQNVSDLFFNGNLEDAFQQATEISMDPTHLAAFSMDLQRTETVVATKEYQQLMPGKDVAQQFNPVNDELSKAYEQAKPFAIEAHLSELLSWITPQDKQNNNDFLDYSQAIWDKLSASISE